MSELFYDAAQKTAVLMAELAHWEGTPFVPSSEVPGTGVDCARLALCPHEATGAISPFDHATLPSYKFDHGEMREDSLLLDWLEVRGAFKQLVPLRKPQRGALAFVAGRKSVHHVVTCLSRETFFHIRWRRRAGVSSWGARIFEHRPETYADRLHSVWAFPAKPLILKS